MKIITTLLLLFMITISARSAEKIDLRNLIVKEKQVSISKTLAADKMENAVVISELNRSSSQRYRYISNGKSLPTELLKANKQENSILQKKSPTAMGPGSTGGGFLNFRGSMPAAERAVKLLVYQFSHMNQNYLNFFLPPDLQNKITPKRLALYISHTKYSYFQEGISITDDNSVNPLEADYISDGNNSYIILLKPFFLHYLDAQKNNSKLPFILRTILLETLHLFIPDINDDQQAYQVSFNLMASVLSRYDLCDTAETCEKLKTIDESSIYNNTKFSTNENLTASHNAVINQAVEKLKLRYNLSQFTLMSNQALYGEMGKIISEYCPTHSNYIFCYMAPLLEEASQNGVEINLFKGLLKKEATPDYSFMTGYYLEFSAPDKNILFISRTTAKNWEIPSLQIRQEINRQNANVCQSSSVNLLSSKKWKYVEAGLEYIVCESSK